MLPISSEFKIAARGYIKEVSFYLIDGETTITESDALQKAQIVVKGGLCKTIMRQATIIHFGGYSFLDKFVTIGYGLLKPQAISKGDAVITIANPAIITVVNHGLETGEKIKFTSTGSLPIGFNVDDFFYTIKIDVNNFYLANTYENSLNDVKIATSGSQSGVQTLIHYPINQFGGVENHDFGTFKVIEQESNEGTEGITIKLYDLMYESLQSYDLAPTYPITMLQLLQLICARLGWSLLTTSFPNSDLLIISELFTNQNLRYRDILEDIAEAAGSIMLFNNDDQLVLKQVNNTVLDTVDSIALRTFKVKALAGPIDTIVLSRSPQNDNIVAST